MFQPLIDQARGIIQRLHTLAEQARDTVPEGQKVRLSEFESWEAATRGIINVVFEPDTQEVLRWRTLGDRRRTLIGDAMRQDMKRGEYYGLIDYFHLAIGLLLEYEATYQHEMAGLAVASRSDGHSLSNGKASRHEQLSPPMAQPQPTPQPAPPEPPAIVRRVADGWEVTVHLNDSTIDWLTTVVARDPTYKNVPADEAKAQMTARIVEHVATTARRANSH